MRTKDTIESKTARTRLKARALSYLTDLEEIRKLAKKAGDYRLAAEINLKLLEHAIGKPRQAAEIEISSPASDRLYGALLKAQDMGPMEHASAELLSDVEPADNESVDDLAESEEG